jgi:hypothetical protein
VSQSALCAVVPNDMNYEAEGARVELASALEDTVDYKSTPLPIRVNPPL